MKEGRKRARDERGGQRERERGDRENRQAKSEGKR